MTMADVGVWQPDAAPLNAAAVARLADAADALDHPTLGLTPMEIAQWGALMRCTRELWTTQLRDEDDARLVRLAKALTVAEMRLPGWEAGARSPVIAIVAELRRRGRYPKDMTAWIRANSTNRFLPYGSLLDRL